MAIWKKIDRSENSEGTTITYAAEGAGRRVLVQSRKRRIPHAASKAEEIMSLHAEIEVLKQSKERLYAEIKRLRQAIKFYESKKEEKENGKD